MFWLIALNVLLIVGLIAAIIGAFLVKDKWRILGVATATIIAIVLFTLWAWPGWMRTALFAPRATADVVAEPAIQTIPAPVVTDAEFDKGVETTITGPAIIQWWDGSTAGCGIIRVDTGRTFTWALMGHWWTFNSQSALESDWTNSIDQYTADNPQCTAALPEGALK